jgi:hypothetical protein
MKKLCRAFFLPLIIAAFVVIPAEANVVRADAGWYDDAWLYRKKITIDHTRVAADLTDFPMLVQLTDGNLKHGAQADGDDIFFTLADGTDKLSHEIENYDSISGELTAWVKIPFLSATVDTDIFLYYGNAVAADQQSVTDVWSNGYEAVYHLHDDFADATGNHDAVNNGSVTTAGRVAGGRGFTPVSEIQAGNWSINSGQLTLQAWLNPASLSQDDPRIISKANSSSAEGHVFMLGLGGTGECLLRGRIKTGTSDFSGTTTLESKIGPAATGIWQLAALIYDGAHMALLKNGVIVGSTGKTGVLRQNDWDISIGNNPGNTSAGWASLDGRLDEVRVSSVARSAGWLITEYNNQNSPATFYSVKADPGWTQTSQVDFESGTISQLDTSGSPGDVRLASSGVMSNYIYALRGNSSSDFWRYDIATNTWSSLTDTPEEVKWGGALAHDGGNYIYAFRGYDNRDFWRYDISADAWLLLADTPSEVKDGGALAYHGSGYVYALRGNTTKDFWRYDIAADTWASLADTQDDIIGGGALTGDGGDYIYALQSGSNRAFYLYDIAADLWEMLADTPQITYSGAALTYSDSGNIYALRGGYSKEFWRYDVAAGSWYSLTDTPFGVEWGGSLTYDGGDYVYALRGRYYRYFWRYDITAGSWSWLANTPGSVCYGGSLATAGIPYYGSGILTSETYDTGFPDDFGSIGWSASVPAGTEIKFQIASNDDNSTWNFKGPDGTAGSYYTSSGTGIGAWHDGDRYIRYRAFFNTTNTVITPVLHDITVDYTRTTALPAVATDGAGMVEETTATVNGTVIDDGGEACECRFEYGTVSGGPYPYNTSWAAGKTGGQSFSAVLSGLSEGTKYYFRAQTRNSSGTANGDEMSLLTKPLPPTGMNFVITVVSDTQIDLSWTKGTGAYRTMIRRKTGGYPVDRNDGVLVYFDTGNSVSDTGLSPGTTYYYRVWSEVTGSQQWSDGYLDVSATTGGELPAAVGGTVFHINKAQVLAPWLGMLLLLAGGIILGLRKWRGQVGR